MVTKGKNTQGGNKKSARNDVMPGFFERGPGATGIVLDAPKKGGATAKKPSGKKKA